MTVSQGLVKIVQGTKGNNSHKWWRVSRNKLTNIEKRVSSEPNFYYAKVYEFNRKTRIVGNQLAYIYWDKDGILTTKIL